MFGAFCLLNGAFVPDLPSNVCLFFLPSPPMDAKIFAPTRRMCGFLRALFAPQTKNLAPPSLFSEKSFFAPFYPIEAIPIYNILRGSKSLKIYRFVKALIINRISKVLQKIFKKVQKFLAKRLQVSKKSLPLHPQLR